MSSTINILSKLHPLYVDKNNSWGNISKEAWSAISCSKEFVDKLKLTISDLELFIKDNTHPQTKDIITQEEITKKFISQKDSSSWVSEKYKYNIENKANVLWETCKRDYCIVFLKSIYNSLIVQDFDFVRILLSTNTKDIWYVNPFPDIDNKLLDLTIGEEKIDEHIVGNNILGKILVALRNAINTQNELKQAKKKTILKLEELSKYYLCFQILKDIIKTRDIKDYIGLTSDEILTKYRKTIKIYTNKGIWIIDDMPKDIQTHKEDILKYIKDKDITPTIRLHPLNSFYYKKEEEEEIAEYVVNIKKERNILTPNDDIIKSIYDNNIEDFKNIVNKEIKFPGNMANLVRKIKLKRLYEYGISMKKSYVLRGVLSYFLNNNPDKDKECNSFIEDIIDNLIIKIDTYPNDLLESQSPIPISNKEKIYNLYINNNLSEIDEAKFGNNITEYVEKYVDSFELELPKEEDVIDIENWNIDTLDELNLEEDTESESESESDTSDDELSEEDEDFIKQLEKGLEEDKHVIIRYKQKDIKITYKDKDDIKSIKLKIKKSLDPRVGNIVKFEKDGKKISAKIIGIFHKDMMGRDLDDPWYKLKDNKGNIHHVSIKDTELISYYPEDQEIFIFRKNEEPEEREYKKKTWCKKHGRPIPCKKCESLGETPFEQQISQDSGYIKDVLSNDMKIKNIIRKYNSNKFKLIIKSERLFNKLFIDSEKKSKHIVISSIPQRENGLIPNDFYSILTPTNTKLFIYDFLTFPTILHSLIFLWYHKVFRYPRSKAYKELLKPEIIKVVDELKLFGVKNFKKTQLIENLKKIDKTKLSKKSSENLLKISIIEHNNISAVEIFKFIFDDIDIFWDWKEIYSKFIQNEDKWIKKSLLKELQTIYKNKIKHDIGLSQELITLNKHTKIVDFDDTYLSKLTSQALTNLKAKIKNGITIKGKNTEWIIYRFNAFIETVEIISNHILDVKSPESTDIIIQILYNLFVKNCKIKIASYVISNDTYLSLKPYVLEEYSKLNAGDTSYEISWKYISFLIQLTYKKNFKKLLCGYTKEFATPINKKAEYNMRTFLTKLRNYLSKMDFNVSQKDNINQIIKEIMEKQLNSIRFWENITNYSIPKRKI